MIPPAVVVPRRYRATATHTEFGTPSLSSQEKALLATMNAEIPALCRTLPVPLRDPAMVTIQRYFASFRLRSMVRFFEGIYAPAWSVLHWIDPARSTLSEERVQLGARIQALALFLHMLDDHLCDGDVPVSHVVLQLRTEAFRRYAAGADELAAGVPGGPELVESLLETYFTGVLRQDEDDDAAACRARTCQELCTGLVSPLLAARRAGVDERRLRAAYEGFVVAWRMLDDLRDAPEDAANGRLTSLYHALPPALQEAWRRADIEAVTRGLGAETVAHFTTRIDEELARAALLATNAKLSGYASELDVLRAGLLPPVSRQTVA